jgi:3'-phosphoadenosine 5'-phosphosulfate (PAPS) 3'-phosphatase
MAAGTLLVHEAGGKLSGMRGEPLDLHGERILADNGAVHEETLELFAEIFQGRYRFELPSFSSDEAYETQRG